MKSFMPLPQRGRRVVCRRCHLVIDDCEPFAKSGEFVHPRKRRDGTAIQCANVGKPFSEDDREVEPFMRKRTRRAAARG